MRTWLSGERRIGIMARLAAGAALLALTTAAVAGCSSDDEAEDEPIEGANSESPEPSQSPTSGDEADVAALEQLYADYWDAVVELDNSQGQLDADLLDGIAEPLVVESELTRMNSYHSHGFHRQGEPTIENVTVEVDGDTARIEACKNEVDWPIVDENGDVVPDAVLEDLNVPHPVMVAAERTADGWRISEVLPTDEATITC